MMKPSKPKKEERERNRCELVTPVEVIEANTSYLKEVRKAAQVLVLEESGAKRSKIAEVTGAAIDQIDEYLVKAHQIFPHFKTIDVFTENREKIIGALENGLLEKIAQELAQDRTNLRDLAYCYAVLHGAGRLERNESTANLSTHVKQSFVKVDLDKLKE